MNYLQKSVTAASAGTGTMIGATSFADLLGQPQSSSAKKALKGKEKMSSKFFCVESLIFLRDVEL